MAEIKITEPPHLVTDLKTLCLATIASHWERFSQEARRKRLIAIRKALDLNLTEFAPMIAVNPVSLSRLERGKHAVSETRIMLAEMVYKANR